MNTKLPRDTVELRLPCEPRFLSVARLTAAGMAARAGLGVAETEDVKVALSEACTNAIEHAYENSTAETSPLIYVRLTARDQELRIEVEDEGRGFDPKRLPQWDLHQPPTLGEGGLGLFLIHQLMDDVKIQSAPGSGTKIIMVKRAAR